MSMKTLTIVLWIIVCLIVSVIIARAEMPRYEAKENLYAKYLGLAFQESASFALGNIDAWAWNGGKSNWPPYNRDIWHLHDGLMFGSSIASYLCYSRWKPKYSLFSLRGVTFLLGNACFTSWIHQRGIRLVQTGKLFPPESGHGFYIRWRWINIEVKSSDELQFGLLGAGVLFLTIDALWEHIF